MATLYIIATPIGNLEDVTHRALRVLGEVEVIFCEDTRITKRLLDHYGISTKTDSYNAHASDAKHERVIDLLEEGCDVALVSDAGTPTISDPGVKVVDMAKEKGIAVVGIPGPSAIVTALSISGISSSEFTFLGFLPHKKGRETLFKEIEESKRTIVFYESTHRIQKTLTSLADILEESRVVAVARELTKIHEEVVRGSAQEVKEYFERNEDKVRGEFVVIVSKR